ncbi:response regulator transcription factor [Xanthomonas translucens]|uniref:Transcriptional regulator n=2 Tax=Xanthomonas campestris pv. translucens TaxID=343 RepID=A0A109HP95_XANCT|nr:response regulator [Xanthomonas translucens]AVY67551.1 transcriptional regulator [Xanthomonas translucens pv. undulosa]KTF40505.1 transcriptional regulator [Xanthomonas translucens pv. translucens]KWV11835.1 transcriptional regulator [Xanthomonas translucens]KWV15789.1 transcriptional regulator [Xanthomonas translucens]MBC3972548.1 response regulator [Xanthomonas translucens pv. undulosa]
MSSTQDPVTRLLLVEDDPISRAFLHVTLQSLPAQVDLADSVASALASAQAQEHDLWLIDANLPDGSGAELLQRLQRQRPGTLALAHTADASGTVREQLLGAGFAEVLLKPLSPKRLLQAVRRLLARGRVGTAPGAVEAAVDWDETTALVALNGERSHLIALRELFLAELPGTRDAVASALQLSDEQAVRNHLHRLQASCGFVGAARLARAVRQLQGDPASSQARSQFSEAVAALLH